MSEVSISPTVAGALPLAVYHSRILLTDFRYIIDKESAARVNTNVQDGLFLMAVSNSCLNPLIYSTYSMRRCRFPWMRKRSREAPIGGKTELQRRSTGTLLTARLKRLSCHACTKVTCHLRRHPRSRVIDTYMHCMLKILTLSGEMV